MGSEDVMTGIIERLAQMEEALRAVQQQTMGFAVDEGATKSPSDRNPSEANSSLDWQFQEQLTPASSTHGNAMGGQQVRDLSRYLGCAIQSNSILTPAAQNALLEVDMLLTGLDFGRSVEEDTSALKGILESSPLTDVPNLYVPWLYPEVDVFYMLFSECRSSTSMDFLDGFSGMTIPQVEEMLLALINCTVHGQQRLQHLICINYMGWLILHVLDGSLASSFISHYQRKKRQSYFENIIFCLKHLELKVQPDLMLLQTACAATHILHSMGYPQPCRRLNQIACQIGLCLQGDEASLQAMSPDVYIQFHFSLVRCNLQDKTIALHCEELPATPMPRLDTTLLDHAGLIPVVSGMTRVMYDLAMAEEAVVHEYLARERSMSPVTDFEGVMQSARATMDQYMSQLPTNTDAYWSYEWLCVDFIYYTILARGIGLRLCRQNDSQIYIDCLMNVREGVDALISMLEHTAEKRSSRMKCLGTLAWIMSYFLLWPLCFLVRHLIVSPDKLDIQRLKRLTDLLDENVRIHSLDTAAVKTARDLMLIYLNYADLTARNAQLSFVI